MGWFETSLRHAAPAMDSRQKEVLAAGTKTSAQDGWTFFQPRDRDLSGFPRLRPGADRAEGPTPMELPPILQGDSSTRLLQGAALGIILTAGIGFTWGGWTLGSTAKTMAERSATSAVVAALAPICVDQFQRATDAPANLVELKKISSLAAERFRGKRRLGKYAGRRHSQLGGGPVVRRYAGKPQIIRIGNDVHHGRRSLQGRREPKAGSRGPRQATHARCNRNGGRSFDLAAVLSLVRPNAYRMRIVKPGSGVVIALVVVAPAAAASRRRRSSEAREAQRSDRRSDRRNIADRDQRGRNLEPSRAWADPIYWCAKPSAPGRRRERSRPTIRPKYRS